MISKMRNKFNSVERIVNVVNDALVYQRNFCDGKAIPHLIVDTEEYPEIAKSIELHQEINEGEVSFTWGITINKKNILLLVESQSPVEISYIINFDSYNQYSIIDRIVSTQLLFIQAGKKGDRLLTTPGKPKLLLEVPHTGFEKEWEKLSRKIQEKRFKNLGVKKKDLDSMIESFNAEWNNVINKHIK